MNAPGAKGGTRSRLVDLDDDALDHAVGGTQAAAAPAPRQTGADLTSHDLAAAAASDIHAGEASAAHAVGGAPADAHAAGGASIPSPAAGSAPDGQHATASAPVDAHGAAGTASSGAAGSGTLANAADTPAPTLASQVDGVLGKALTQWVPGMNVGHVNAGMTGGGATGAHTQTDTGTSVVMHADRTGVTVSALETASAAAGATWTDGPVSAQVHADAKANATESIHVGTNGIDATLKAGVSVSVSEGVSVSGNLGHGVSGSIGAENVSEAHASAGLRISNTQVEAAARAGASDTLEAGAGFKADVGGGVDLTSEVHAGVKVIAGAQGHAALGTGEIGASGGAGVGAVETVGGSFGVGNHDISGHAGGSLDSPGAVGVDAGASARLQDGVLSLDLNGKIDLGFGGIGLNVGAKVDVSVPEHAIESGANYLAGHAAGAATDAGHAVVEGATAVGHGLTTASHAISHGFRSLFHHRHW